jgi:hypothetical protein
MFFFRGLQYSYTLNSRRNVLDLKKDINMYIYYVVFITEVVRRRPSRSLGPRTSASEDNKQMEFTAFRNKNAAWRLIVILPSSKRCLSVASSTMQDMHRQETTMGSLDGF